MLNPVPGFCILTRRTLHRTRTFWLGTQGRDWRLDFTFFLANNWWGEMEGVQGLHTLCIFPSSPCFWGHGLHNSIWCMSLGCNCSLAANRFWVLHLQYHLLPVCCLMEIVPGLYIKDNSFESVLNTCVTPANIGLWSVSVQWGGGWATLGPAPALNACRGLPGIEGECGAQSVHPRVAGVGKLTEDWALIFQPVILGFKTSGCRFFGVWPYSVLGVLGEKPCRATSLKRAQGCSFDAL